MNPFLAMNIALAMGMLKKRKDPPPLERLPDDADPSCSGAGHCYMFDPAGPGYCATGCRLAVKQELRELQDKAEVAFIKDLQRSESLAAQLAMTDDEREIRVVQVKAWREERAARQAEAERAKLTRLEAERIANTPGKTLRRRARKAAQARLRADVYVPWERAGGPDECAHGVAASIACRQCDLETVRGGR